MNDSTLHAAIIDSFLHRQRPPTVRELADHFGQREPGPVRAALRGLAERHGVVLHPGSDEVWVAHPFSAAPTSFVVKSGGRSWWGNCAWCSLGLAHLAGGDAVIETRDGGLGEPAIIRIEDGRLLDTDHVVHFPIPMRDAWNNVIYTCSVMLLFRSEGHVEAWCAERGVRRGDVRPIAQIWPVAAEWYGRHAEPTWTKWSMREAAAMFERHGLSGPTWELGDASGRF